jgi:4-hydroxybenzoate polyprenyltransferase
MSNEKHNFNEFISAEMFTSLAGCMAIVCGLVQLLKMYLPFEPLWLNLFASFAVVCIRIMLKDCQSWKEILLGILQIIPIMLGATGVYEFTKNILGG